MATIDGETITVAEFEREMKRRTLQPGQFASLEHRRELLTELVRQKTLEAAARKDGYADHPEVQKVLREAMIAKYLADQLDAAVAEAAVAEADIERYYQEHADRYRVAQRLRGAIILIAVPQNATAERVAEYQAEAVTIRDQAVAADDRAFAALARRHSDDGATRYLAGNIGWITNEGRPLKWGSDVVNALFELRQPGDVAPVVRGKEGFYVVRLTDQEDEKLRPLSQVRTGIAHVLLKERTRQVRQTFYDSLYADLDVVLDDALLEAAKPPPGVRGPLRPPSVPGAPARDQASMSSMSDTVDQTKPSGAPPAKPPSS